MYGKERANQAFKLFKAINKQSNISLRQVCIQIQQMMDHSARLQLIHFLFGIAKSDDHVSQKEVYLIEQISMYLRINQNDFQSIKAMFYKTKHNAYKILEIQPESSLFRNKKRHIEKWSKNFIQIKFNI